MFSRAPIKWVLLRIPPNSQPPQFITNITPPGFDRSPTYVHDAVLSPRGDRIAWMLPYQVRSSKIDLLMGRISRTLGLKTVQKPDTAIWVSDTNGRNMRLVTTWFCGDGLAGSLKWSPDGSTISFDQVDYIPAPLGHPSSMVTGYNIPYQRDNIMAVDAPRD